MGKKSPKTIEVGEPLGSAEPAHRVTTLAGVIGHERAKGVLLSSFTSGRVHHAWIFHGPAGVGKLTSAVAFAGMLLDPTTAPNLSGEPEPDPDSPVQQLVRAGTHPDLRVITKELAAVSADDRTRSGKQITLPIEVVREFLIDPASKSRSMVMSGDASRSGSRASRVFIIDEAELMDQRTQNVLLKTMEEPPAGCVIILVTSSEDRLLPTIRSRSQRVAFTSLSDEEMRVWLSRRASGEDEASLTAEAERWVLRFASGSPGAADSAIRNELYGWHAAIGQMLGECASGVFPPELGPTMGKLVDERAAAAVKSRPEASKDAMNKAWARRMLAYVSEDARSRLRAASVGGDQRSIARALATIDAVGAAEQHLASNVNLGLLLENLAAQMSGEPLGMP